LLQLFLAQERDVHEVDEGPTVLKLFLDLVELSVKLFEADISELLVNSVDKSFKL